MKTDPCRVQLIVQPFCGDAPCPDDDDPNTGALLVRRVILNGLDLPFTKAKLISDGNPGIVALEVAFVPTALEITTAVDVTDPALVK